MNPESSHYKWFVLAALTIVYVFNFMDRYVMILLQEPIKTELGLSDTQLGLLTGLAFSMLYTILGIPLARIADKHNRRNLLVACLTFWSLMTVLSGRAFNFIQLMLTRMGVSMGEAGGMPSSHSILSDYFPAKQRGTVFAIYNTGVYAGILCGFAVAGVIAAQYGWRVAFYSLGLPGILLALLLFFTIKEPIRGRLEKTKTNTSKASLKEVVSYLFERRSFRYLCLGAGFMTYALYSSTNFCPSYLIRYHQLDIRTVGLGLGLCTGIGGIIGAFAGGRLADIFGQRNKRWYLYIPMLAALLTIGPALLRYWVEDGLLAIYMVIPYMLASAAFLGPIYAVGQSLAPPHMRAFATAIILVFINVIGLTGGPFVVGFISDNLSPEYGALSLRYAITINFIGLLIAAFMFWMASRYYEEDLEKG